MLLLYQFNLKKLLQTGFVDSKLNKLSILIFPDEFDAYIIVSFVNATLVLSIGDTVEEVTDSGFLGTTPTLCCSALGDDALVQVYPDGIRHIRADRRVNEWKAPNKKTIVKCAVNQRQVVIALSGGELVYFEMDPVSFPMNM
jgi:splicing factor 3B subunit 3